jgi:hypothetical protein
MRTNGGVFKSALRLWIRCLVVAAVGASCSSGRTNDVGTTETEQLDVLLGRADPQVTKRVLEEQVDNQQRMIVTCMSDRGFEYRARAAKALFTIGPKAELDAHDFASTYGFGYITLSGPNAPAPSIFDADPNESIYSALSEAGQSAWFAALDACEARANDQRGLLGVTAENAQAVDRFTAQVRTDPKVLDAVAAWSICMRGAGFSYESPAAMHDSLRTQADQLAEKNAWESGSPLHAEYSAQADLERQVALADLECAPAFVEAESAVIEELRASLLDQLQ